MDKKTYRKKIKEATISSEDPRRQEMIHLFKSGLTYRAIGCIYGLCKARIFQIIHKIN